MFKLATKYRAQTRVFMDASSADTCNDDTSVEQSLKPVALQKRHSLSTLGPPLVSSMPTTTGATTATTPQPRRMSLSVPATLAKPLVQDYNLLVEDNNKIKKYAKQPDGDYLATTLCLLCEATRPQIVFFPCQHMCMCHGCLLDHDVLGEETMWTACMVCRHEIHMMLPHTGEEETLYWQCINKVGSILPPDFKDEFKQAATILLKVVSSSSLDLKAATVLQHVRSVPSAYAPTATPSKWSLFVTSFQN